MVLTTLYQHVEADDSDLATIADILAKYDIQLVSVQFEHCYYIDTKGKELSEGDRTILRWLTEQPFQTHQFLVDTPSGLISEHSKFTDHVGCNFFQFEIGPRLNYSTPYSTNAVSICNSAGVGHVSRFERSRRFHISVSNILQETRSAARKALLDGLHDQMTEMCYEAPIESFDLACSQSEVFEVDILQEGRKALDKVNQKLGLAMDDWDLDYYTDLFLNKIKRNPTNVECFDLAQSNSEHCRHWFFGGKLVIEGEEKPTSLFKLVKSTQDSTNPNNKIKFSDNSSCIEGYEVKTFHPSRTGESSRFVSHQVTQHIILTAETHNFPTAVAPFPGATTGTGGRIRDVQATGRGANVVAGTVGYCFGNLNIPGYELPWEDDSFMYPSNFASPLNIIIEGSNGASDYGNKYGEPVICGFARSFGLMIGEERREWIKPILFSGGLGSIADEHVNKKVPEKGDVVVKVGGPVYRIGVGGGAASSIQVQGDNACELDLGAVQRGDAEMEQKMNRVIRACIESEGANPILSIHDQGAGGNGNVLKEICEPKGAVIHCDAFQLGDPTLNVLELWGAEYQESNALLAKPENRKLIAKIARREKCEASFVGEITGNGKIQLTPFGYLENGGSIDTNDVEIIQDRKRTKLTLPVDLDLEYVLGDMPRKVFELSRKPQLLRPLSLPVNVTVKDALYRILQLPAVASKRYLTNKVDRSVTGLVAQQQCVGPLHTPLADVAVTALSYWSTKGAATAIGEQPIKTLVSPECGARMSVGESLTNLSFALITELKDVKCSANWMWAAKLPGEGSLMYDACNAMCDVMKELGVAVDGGKDSLSMAARVNDTTVKSPGAIVISTYAACEDIRKTVTPDLKCPDNKGELLYLNLSKGQSSMRLGGSALAQVYKQIGDECPDLDDSSLFTRGFKATQAFVKDGLIAAGHDISDGGVLTCLLEMAFAGNYGCDVTFTSPSNEESLMGVLAALFHEELGYILEVRSSNLKRVEETLNQLSVEFQHIGHSTNNQNCIVSIADCDGTHVVLHDTVATLRDQWEQTSFRLEMHQCNNTYVAQERDGMAGRKTPPYKLTYNTEETQAIPPSPDVSPPRLAVIREEGSNGDREMAAAFFSVGFEVHDVTMTDLISGSVTLDRFRGIAFVGGFSYADVLGSAKGWAASVTFHDSVKAQFLAFYKREDTFSLGVCNGCQLMTLLGWVGDSQTSEDSETDNCKVFMGENSSGRYESRFCTVRIDDSPAIMLDGMSGSTLGIWVAHGEGKMNFRSADIYSSLSTKKLLPIKYVNDSNRPAALYPFNPNGSPGGAAAVCSPDGRHLAMMPHPERCFMTWQWPWMPQSWIETVQTSPWLKMFRNAYDWCLKSSA